jgi:hypothetical protein
MIFSPARCAGKDAGWPPVDSTVMSAPAPCDVYGIKDEIGAYLRCRRQPVRRGEGDRRQLALLLVTHRLVADSWSLLSGLVTEVLGQVAWCAGADPVLSW